MLLGQDVLLGLPGKIAPMKICNGSHMEITDLKKGVTYNVKFTNPVYVSENPFVKPIWNEIFSPLPKPPVYRPDVTAPCAITALQTSVLTDAQLM